MKKAVRVVGAVLGVVALLVGLAAYLNKKFEYVC